MWIISIYKLGKFLRVKTRLYEKSLTTGKDKSIVLKKKEKSVIGLK